MLFPAMAQRTSNPFLSSKISQFSLLCGSMPNILSDGGTFKLLGMEMLPKSTKKATHQTESQSWK